MTPHPKAPFHWALRIHTVCYLLYYIYSCCMFSFINDKADVDRQSNPCLHLARLPCHYYLVHFCSWTWHKCRIAVCYHKMTWWSNLWFVNTFCNIRHLLFRSIIDLRTKCRQTFTKAQLHLVMPIPITGRRKQARWITSWLRDVMFVLISGLPFFKLLMVMYNTCMVGLRLTVFGRRM